MGGAFSAKDCTALDGDSFFPSEREEEYIKEKWKIIKYNMQCFLILYVIYVCVFLISSCKLVYSMHEMMYKSVISRKKSIAVFSLTCLEIIKVYNIR